MAKFFDLLCQTVLVTFERLSFKGIIVLAVLLDKYPLLCFKCVFIIVTKVRLRSHGELLNV